ncbi:hypothetical protein GJ496_002904 [Pomphorhynchus laevis]|nr:hypothetical protein GJ496_002904 [Pomphorhynchus laevis]
MIDKDSFISSMLNNNDELKYDDKEDRCSLELLRNVLCDKEDPDNVRYWYAPTSLFKQDRTINHIRFHPNCPIFASASSNTIYIYDVEKAELLFSFIDPDVEEEFLTLDWTLNGTRLITAGKRMTIRILPVQGGGEVNRPLQGHGGPIRIVRACHCNSNWILSGSDDYSCRLWDIESGKTLVRFAGVNGHTNNITALDEHPSGTRFVSCSIENILVWNLEDSYTGKKIVHEHFPLFRINNVHSYPPVTTIKWVDNFILSLAESNCALLWEPKDEGCVIARFSTTGEDQEAKILTTFTINIQSMALCAGDICGNIHMWDLLSFAECPDTTKPIMYTHKWSHSMKSITSLSFNGKQLIASCGNEIGLWIQQRLVTKNFDIP